MDSPHPVPADEGGAGTVPSPGRLAGETALSTLGLSPGSPPYTDGRRYVDGLVGAVLTARAGRLGEATRQARAADFLLAALGEENDPEALRDFIAGAARAADDWLHQAGIPTL